MTKISIIVLILPVFFSCNQHSCSEEVQVQKNIMKDWYMKKLFIPNNLRLVNVGEKVNSFNIYHPNSQFYVLHYFEADCSKCIDELKDAKAELNSSGRNLKNVKFLFVGTGATDAILKDILKQIDFNYPVYFDPSFYHFMTINKIPIGTNQSAYKTMLLNKDNQVLLFGAFYENKKAWNLYKDLVNCMNEPAY